MLRHVFDQITFLNVWLRIKHHVVLSCLHLLHDCLEADHLQVNRGHLLNVIDWHRAVYAQSYLVTRIEILLRRIVIRKFFAFDKLDPLGQVKLVVLDLTHFVTTFRVNKLVLYFLFTWKLQGFLLTELKLDAAVDCQRLKRAVVHHVVYLDVALKCVHEGFPILARHCVITFFFSLVLCC